MAITITKKGSAEAVAKTVEAAEAESTELEAKIDKFGENYVEAADLKEHLKGYEAEMKTIRGDLDEIVDEDTPADQEATLTGKKYSIKFGAKGNMGRVTDASEAFKMLEAIEAGLGWQLMSFSLTDLKKYLTPKQFDKVTEYEAKKARTVTVVENAGK